MELARSALIGSACLTVSDALVVRDLAIKTIPALRHSYANGILRALANGGPVNIHDLVASTPKEELFKGPTANFEQRAQVDLLRLPYWYRSIFRRLAGGRLVFAQQLVLRVERSGSVRAPDESLQLRHRSAASRLMRQRRGGGPTSITTSRRRFGRSVRTARSASSPRRRAPRVPEYGSDMNAKVLLCIPLGAATSSRAVAAAASMRAMRITISSASPRRSKTSR
jgi:hypothetical protein